ncbi:MAG TPA: SMC-Scp complex subunit ScpB [Flavisolibacter sp.]|jgi:segregation and condensation protein B
MELSNLIPHIEALIFASEKPLSTVEITELINSAFGFMDNKVEEPQVVTALEGIVEKYDSEFYPFEVRQSGGGWQFLTKKDFHKTVAQLNGEKFLKRLSAAALETLAIIAYKQPITKGEIESIRGVSSDYSVQKLLEKELIVISGRNEKLPGHPLVYITSKSFMDYFGINSADDLPRIKEVLAEQMVIPTAVSGADFEQSDLVVTDEGELLIPGESDIAAEGDAPYINGHHFDEQDPDSIEPASDEELSEKDFQVDAEADAAAGNGPAITDQDEDIEPGDPEGGEDQSSPAPSS